ncbi:hypothetical protein SLS56_007046 [Neofusicoccum ribis]|uniref:Uncharacterized protein n=1 Tax=Neofusicoccum ribis TaxID=45134 RepID=A0ABR3SP10_9PEZI
MGLISFFTLVLGVPATLVALFSLVERAQGRRGPANSNADAPVNGVRYVYHLTCVYAPKAFFVFTFLSFNYQNVHPTVQSPGNTAAPSAQTEASVVGGRDNDNVANIDPANLGVSLGGGELPQYVQDLREE